MDENHTLSAAIVVSCEPCVSVVCASSCGPNVGVQGIVDGVVYPQLRIMSSFDGRFCRSSESDTNTHVRQITLIREIRMRTSARVLSEFASD